MPAGAACAVRVSRGRVLESVLLRARMAELEQTHFVAGKVFVFQVPKLESSEGFKAASWPKTPIWTGQLRVVSKGDKVSVLLEHTDKGQTRNQHRRHVQPRAGGTRASDRAITHSMALTD